MQSVLDVPEAKDYWDLALENGHKRYEDAVKHNPLQKKQINRNPFTEADSILLEIAVALAAGVDPNSLCLFVPREWNGKRFVLPKAARLPDVGRIEARRVNGQSSPLDTYGKDYVCDAVVVRGMVFADHTAMLNGYAVARDDWKGDTIPTTSHWYTRYPGWKSKELHDMSTIDWGWAQ